MITADGPARKSTSGALPARNQPAASAPPVGTRDAGVGPRPLSALVSDVVCTLVLLALGVSAGFPLVWGMALHQTPMAVSAGCTELLCAIVLLNRCFAPAATRTHAVPFLTALEERPWVLALCLVLALASALTLATYWPGHA